MLNLLLLLFVLFERYSTRNQLFAGAIEFTAELQYKASKVGEKESLLDASKRIMKSFDIYLNLMPNEKRSDFKSSQSNYWKNLKN